MGSHIKGASKLAKHISGEEHSSLSSSLNKGLEVGVCLLCSKTSSPVWLEWSERRGKPRGRGQRVAKGKSGRRKATVFGSLRSLSRLWLFLWAKWGATCRVLSKRMTYTFQGLLSGEQDLLGFYCCLIHVGDDVALMNMVAQLPEVTGICWWHCLGSVKEKERSRIIPGFSLKN